MGIGIYKNKILYGLVKMKIGIDFDIPYDENLYEARRLALAVEFNKESFGDFRGIVVKLTESLISERRHVDL